MVVGRPHAGAGYAVDEGDPRITRVGSCCADLARRAAAALVNVLRGEMSLVGPRPTLALPGRAVHDRQRRRLEVRPGITGWAQVNGRTSLSWPERIELDVWYVDHRSLALDLRILAAHRLGAAAPGRVYRGEQGGWRAP